MSIFPFIIAVFVLVAIALFATFFIGFKPEETKQRGFKERSRNLLIIYGIITILMFIALGLFLYFK
jgi:hypothetical protein